MHRFFLTPEAFIGEPPEEILLRPGSRDLVHQIHTVLRLSPGETILVFDGMGSSYEVVLNHVDRKEIRGLIRSVLPATGEPRTPVVLYASPLRRENYEWVLQKGTELGITGYVPLLCARTIDRPKSIPERWRRILIEASEQSHRGRVPEISHAVDFASAVRESGRAGVIFHESSRQDLNPDLFTNVDGKLLIDGRNVTSLNIFIGPEGGFTPEEIELAKRCGLLVIGLGPRVLRAETAAVAAVTLMMHFLGELRHV